MADNFDLRQYLAENKLGPYAKVRIINEGVTAAPIQPTSGGEADPWTKAVKAINKKYAYKTYHDEIEEFMNSESGQAAMTAGTDPVKAYEEYYNIKRESVNEALSPEAIDRIESMVPQRDLALAMERLDYIAQVLDDDGFSQADIANYIHDKIAERFGQSTMSENTNEMPAQGGNNIQAALADGKAIGGLVITPDKTNPQYTRVQFDVDSFTQNREGISYELTFNPTTKVITALEKGGKYTSGVRQNLDSILKGGGYVKLNSGNAELHPKYQNYLRKYAIES